MLLLGANSNASVCFDKQIFESMQTEQFQTELSCCCYDVFSDVLIASLIASENKSKWRKPKLCSPDLEAELK